MNWIILILAGLCEVGFAFCLGKTRGLEGLPYWEWMAGFAAFYVLSAVLLAKATDQRLLARWKDNPRRIEALLMGQAGMLEGYFEDDYPRQLQADYEALRT